MTEDKKKPLNIRQKKYIDNRIKGMTQVDAHKKAGYKGNTEQAASSVEKNLIKLESVRDAFEKVGITGEKLAEKVKDQLEATKTITISEKSVEREVVDNQARAKGIELAGKFRGDFVEKKELSVTGMEGLRFVIEGLDDIEEVETKD